MKKEFQHFKDETRKEIVNKATEQLKQSKSEWLREEQRLESLNAKHRKDKKLKVHFADTQRGEQYHLQLIEIVHDWKKLSQVNRWLSILNIKPLLNLAAISHIDDFIEMFNYTEQVILEAYRELLVDLAIRDNGQVCNECMNAAIEARDGLLDNFVYKIQFIKNNLSKS